MNEVKDRVIERDGSELTTCLRKAARDRWDDLWTIEVRHFADGTSRAHAYSNRGQTEEGHQIRERLMPGADGELHHERIVVEGAETIVKEAIGDA